MRKYFLSLVAMATMILFSGCNKNEDFYISENGDMVTFNIATPEMGTRAFSDGTTANKLIVAVYQGGQYREALTQNVTINGSAQVSLPLVTGVTYDIVFWAYAEGAPYTFNAVDHTVSVNYNNEKANNEKLDAFYANRIGYEVKGPKTETIELRRPFAQLNVATKDYNDAVNSGIVIEKTSIKVEKAYNTLNLFNGEVSGEQTIELAQDLTPMENGQRLQGYEDYSWLSMNYILVDGQTTVTATMGTDNQNVTRSWTFIPLQRNYRTNILGNILTTTTDFNVVIDEEFAGEDINPGEWDGQSIIEPKVVNGVYQIDGAAQLAWLAAAVNGTLPADTKATGRLPTHPGHRGVEQPETQQQLPRNRPRRARRSESRDGSSGRRRSGGHRIPDRPTLLARAARDQPEVEHQLPHPRTTLLRLSALGRRTPATRLARRRAPLCKNPEERVRGDKRLLLRIPAGHLRRTRERHQKL